MKIFQIELKCADFLHLTDTVLFFHMKIAYLKILFDRPHNDIVSLHHIA